MSPHVDSSRELSAGFAHFEQSQSSVASNLPENMEPAVIASYETVDDKGVATRHELHSYDEAERRRRFLEDLNKPGGGCPSLLGMCQVKIG